MNTCRFMSARDNLGYSVAYRGQSLGLRVYLVATSHVVVRYANPFEILNPKP